MVRSILAAACALATLAFTPATLAQSWPNRPVKIIVGFPPGGSTDLAARVVAAKLSQSLGQSFIVENRAGASGNIGSEAVARAAPDGYTLLMAATSFAAAPAFFDKLSWDPVKDFAPIGMVATVPIMVVTNPSVPAKNVRELVAYSKANAGKVNMASPGATTLVRLSGEHFKQAAKLDWTTVHYKGGAPAMQDMLAGTAQVMFANISDVLQQVRAGKLNAIAVTTPQRSSLVPEIPTLAESGYPEVSYSTWQALVGPAGLPRDIVDKLNGELRTIMAMPDVKAQFAGFGTDVSTSSPEELGSFLAGEVAKIRKVAASVGAKND